MSRSENPGETFFRTQPCDLCGTNRFEAVGRVDRRGDQLATVVCCHCGLVSHGAVPTDAELQQYYGRQYRRDYHGEITPSAHRVVRAWNNGRRIYELLRPRLKTADRIFEVGAGIGCTVKTFELAGHDASGIEPNEGFCAFSQTQLASRLENVNLLDVPGQGVYDLVLLIHVIEHFNSPTRALRYIHRLLSPGGRLYIECPNLAAPHAAPGKLFHFAHIYNFTPKTLVMMARACGFEPTERFTTDRDRNLAILLTRVEQKGNSPSRLDIDRQSCSATLKDMTRYNALTYHLRGRYLYDRLKRAYEYRSDHVFAERRLRQIIDQCTRHARARGAESRGPSKGPGSTQRAA